MAKNQKKKEKAEPKAEIIDLTAEGASFSPIEAKKGALFRVRDARKGSVELSTQIISWLATGPYPVDTSDCIKVLATCAAYGLNPVVGDCYIVKTRADRPADIMIAADSFLRRAADNPEYGGYVTGWILSGKNKGRKYIEAGTDIPAGWDIVGAWSKGFRQGKHCPTVECMIQDYKKPGKYGKGAWDSMTETMIAKVAKSQALRLAFPERLGGAYSEDEIRPIRQVECETTDMPPEKTPEVSPEPQNGDLTDELAKGLGFTHIEEEKPAESEIEPLSEPGALTVSIPPEAGPAPKAEPGSLKVSPPEEPEEFGW